MVAETIENPHAKGDAELDTDLLRDALALAFALFVAWELYRLILYLQGLMPALSAGFGLPYAINSWADQPLFVQIHRIAGGTAPYRPLHDADSFTYGPIYPYLVALLDRITERVPTLTHLRVVAASIGLATVVPLLVVLGALRKARAEPSALWAFLVAGAYTVASFVFIDLRQITATSLHPDSLTFFFVLTGVAAVLWYPHTKYQSATLTVLFAACFLNALTKLNTAPQVLFFVGALVVSRELRIRKALWFMAFFVVGFLLVHGLEPRDMREWTLIIPTHHALSPLSSVLDRVTREWTVAQPWQPLVFFGALASLGIRVRERPWQVTVFAIILCGVATSGLLAWAKVGGAPNDLWMLYVVCLLPIGTCIEEALAQPTRGSWPSIAGVAISAIFVLSLPFLAARGAQPVAPSPEARAELASTASQLRALCKPGRTIMVTWFADPLIDCPGTTFPLWDSVEEITWAGPEFAVESLFNQPITPDAIVVIREEAFPFRLNGPYLIARTLPVYSGSSYGYFEQHLDVWERQTQSSR